jgi:ubiquinol-cytochrome c reductase cytochrome b subunit
MIIAVLSLVHLLYLHDTGSSNPLGVTSDCDIIKFHPYFSVKDLVGFCLMWFCLGFVVLFCPNILIDPENFINGNPLVTPTHIQPEWYFLPMYAILRSIPNKLGGVVALVIRIFILYFLPLFIKPKLRSGGFNPLVQLVFWFLCSSFLVLMWIGSKPVEAPYEHIGRLFTFIYFFIYFLIYFSHQLWDL